MPAAAAPHSSAAFSTDAARYDAPRRKLIPCFDDFYGTVVSLIAAWPGPEAPRVLDLGAGTGLLSTFVLKARPNARLHLLDGSDAMLAIAADRFAHAANVTYEVADMTDADLGGPWDLAVSALAIHHLEHDGKKALLRRIRSALAPGGLFINAEQVLGPTPAIEASYVRRWQDEARALGVAEDELGQAMGRMVHDRCATVEEQLGWMRDAGFTEVDCSFKAWRFAVLSGRRD